MLIGLLSDAHGNIFGLTSCVERLRSRGAKDIYFLGDAVNYFGHSRQVLDYLAENDISCIKGNHEQILLIGKTLPSPIAETYNLPCTIDQLEPEHLEYIRGWKNTLELNCDGIKIMMVHGSPFEPLAEYVYPDDDLTRFRDLKHDLIFLGHTHRPFIRTIGEHTVVNVGSVGFSRSDGRYLNCALLDTSTGKTEIISVPFPTDRLDDLKPFPSALIRILERRESSESHA